MQRAQMAALAAMRAAAAGLGHPASPGSEDEDTAHEGAPGSPGQSREGPGHEGDQHLQDAGSDDDLKPKWGEEDLEEDLGEEEEEDDYEDEEDEDEDEEGLGPPGPPGLGSPALFSRKAQQQPQAFRSDGLPRGPGGQERPGPAHAAGSASLALQLQPPDHGDWTYEEQFKQLYELDGDPKRKEFLDDLFGFMQKRGTPVNRIPIMAKQVLDLFMLYVLVTEKGGLVEVINKKLWREVTKGLHLPTSITSAAFTLRTQLRAVSDDETVRLWDVQSKQCTRTVPLKGPVTNAAIVLAPVSMLSSDFRPSLPLPHFNKHLLGAEHGDEVRRGGLTLRLGLHQQGSEPTYLSRTEQLHALMCGTSEKNVLGGQDQLRVRVTELEDEVRNLRKVNRDLFDFSTRIITRPAK
ncbi:AT-rich interactive domain-containing protein 3A [Tupaia chinensis]|uniref:AT-rich interactive domain-containing protein 3 n=1 Tax=Tupaia chinensis TaxID=246437 RepID=L8Y4K8_TUPCH|nr:AT-rich interactive domain-containing protein 3A [Tupaia chinensis]